MNTATTPSPVYGRSIENILRILVDMIKDDTALLIMIGTHDEVY